MKTNIQLAAAWMTDLGGWKKSSLLRTLTCNHEALRGGKRIFAELYGKRRQLPVTRNERSMREEWMEVYRAGGLNYEFGRLTYQIIKLQTVETVERVIRPIGRDDREDVELLTTLFNVDGAEE